MGAVHALTEATDRDRLGAKAVNLGRLVRAGLPVPPAFCVDESVAADDPAIAAAYQALGGGAVAVRSSAVGEDGATSAAAGVYQSRLGVHGLHELTAAIGDVRGSVGGSVARTYRPGIAPPMAVIVQSYVEADIAGVVFTRDPGDESGRSLAVAANRGPATIVVGGAAADRLRVDRLTRRVIASPAAPCLTADQLHDLTALTLRVEELFGEPCDVEWASAGGQFWLLQARPITTSPIRDLERLRRREIDTLRPLVGPLGNVWARYHLAESAPRPTPMTWGVLRTLLSVGGGYGRMLRSLGFTPDPRVDETGFVQLIAGQPYLNLNLEARLDHADIPYTVDVGRLKQSPALALVPQRQLFFAGTTSRFWIRLPAILWRVWRQSRRLRRLQSTYSDDLRTRVFPAFAAEIQHARATGLGGLSSAEVVGRFEEWRERTLADFAASALQPGVFASLALSDLLAGADEAERARRVEGLGDVLAASGSVDGNMAAALRALFGGSLDLTTFLAEFGHRCPEELELAQPRWSEVAPTVGERPQTGRVAGLVPAVRTAGPRPAAPAVKRYCAAVAMRETGRHYLMMGYTYLRELLLELDRRFGLGGGIFFLRPEELPALVAGEPVHDRIRPRRRDYNILRNLNVPAVLFGEDLDAIGRPVDRADFAEWSGQPIAPGRGEGPAVVATVPADVCQSLRPGFVLVCPYIDAGWLPVVVHANAVVLETGTDLSHGAILLREFGIPAAAGFPGILSLVTAGERLRVDGRSGTVTRPDRP